MRAIVLLANHGGSLERQRAHLDRDVATLFLLAGLAASVPSAFDRAGLRVDRAATSSHVEGVNQL